MADRRVFESQLEERLRAYAARASRPFDADAIVADAVAGHRPSRRGTFSLPWPRLSLPTVAAALLILSAVVLAMIAALTLSGRPRQLQGDINLLNVPPSVPPLPIASVEPSPSPIVAPSTPAAPTVTDPHTLLLVTSRMVISPGSSCANVDRLGTRDSSTRRVVACAERFMMTPDRTSAAIAGPRGMTIVDLRDGHVLGTIETGGFTFPIAWSPSGRWLQWESCGRDKSGPCSVRLSARDGSGQHELYRTRSLGFMAPTTWLPDESRVAVTTGFDASKSEATVLVGSADGSGLRPLASGGPESRWAGGIGDGVIDWAPDGRGYLYFAGPFLGSCASFCVQTLSDVMSQAVSQGVNDGPPVNLTNLAPGQFAVDAAWSPDGRTLAFLRKTIDPAIDKYEQQGAIRAAPAELWLRDGSGAMRRIAMPEPQDGSVNALVAGIRWSPDGSRLTMEAANGHDGSDMRIDTYLVAADGSTQRVLSDARKALWSPDGTELAFLHRVGPDYLPNDGPAAPATIEVTSADGSDRHQIPLPPGEFDDFWISWATN